MVGVTQFGGVPVCPVAQVGTGTAVRLVVTSSLSLSSTPSTEGSVSRLVATDTMGEEGSASPAVPAAYVTSTE